VGVRVAVRVAVGVAVAVEGAWRLRGCRGGRCGLGDEIADGSLDPVVVLPEVQRWSEPVAASSGQRVTSRPGDVEERRLVVPIGAGDRHYRAGSIAGKVEMDGHAGDAGPGRAAEPHVAADAQPGAKVRSPSAYGWRRRGRRSGRRVAVAGRVAVGVASSSPDESAWRSRLGWVLYVVALHEQGQVPLGLSPVVAVGVGECVAVAVSVGVAVKVAVPIVVVVVG